MVPLCRYVVAFVSSDFVLSDMSLTIPVCSQVPFTWNIVFQPFAFSLCLCSEVCFLDSAELDLVFQSNLPICVFSLKN